MNPDSTEDPIDVFLRKPADQALPDHGFTIRVLTRLSVAAVKKPRNRRPFPLPLGSIGAGTITAGIMLLLGTSITPSNSGESSAFAELAHQLYALASDDGLALGLSMVTLSFTTLWFLDQSSETTE